MHHGVLSVLGLKGTLSEAELFTLRTRLAEGRWNKARRGELVFPLPVGYVRGTNGRWELDPDMQVRERMHYVFAVFRRTGVARAVLRDLVAHHLELPVRLSTKEEYGTLVWKAPTLSAVIRTLSNPAYAGAYVFGRWSYTGERRSATNGTILPHLLPLEEWKVCLQDHHPAYLPWEEFLQNRAQLRANWTRDGHPGVAREGRALLQGMVYCGVCGRKMSVQHRARSEHRSAYLCDRAYAQGAAPLCQSMTARPVDAAVAEAFLDAVSPLQLDVALQVLDQIEGERAGLRRQWELQLEQARYEARLAQRQYDAIDPENRLVAAELERRWNQKLERVVQLEQAYARAEQEEHWTLRPEQRERVRTLAQDLPGIWEAPTTTNQERKQLLRFAIDAVFLDGKSSPGEIGIQIRWQTGTVTQMQVRRPAPGDGSLRTPSAALALIRELAPTHSYAAIAVQVNAAGWQTAFGRAFTSQHVGYLCRRHGWARGSEHSTQSASETAEATNMTQPSGC